MIVGNIYRITSPHTLEIYIGSTLKSIEYRFKCHLSEYRRYLNNTFHHVSSFDVIGHGDAQIELIERFVCRTRVELAKRERFHIEHNIDYVTNKVLPGKTNEEDYRYCDCGTFLSKETHQSHHVKSRRHRQMFEL
jgi:hypothetical protein